MKSAHRRFYIARKEKKGKKTFPFFKILTPILIVGLFLMYVRLNTHVWNGNDKVAVVYKDKEDVAVTVFNPILSEVTTFKIPGDTEVDVARNYGTFRIKNVWQFGINEKAGGALLAETVTQNFLFPVFLWTGKTLDLSKVSFGEMLSFVFLPGTTNIAFGDRLQIGMFALRVQELGKTNIDLGKSQFLDKGILNDGYPGYKIGGPISQRLTIYFSENELGGIKVNITDATGVQGVSEKLGEILQVIGGKVVSIDKKNVPENLDCTVRGKNKVVMEKVVNLFSCQVGKGDSSFDLDITVGQEFAKRF